MPTAISEHADKATRAPIPEVLQQHVGMAAHLRDVRSILVRAPHVRLLQLARLDERIAAQLDGIAVGGDHGTALCHQALDPLTAGAVFAATVRAIETRDAERTRMLLAIAQVDRIARRGAISAFGWVSAASLRGITAALLASADTWSREVGLAACAMHQVDPGSDILAHSLGPASDPAVRSRALHVCVALGRVALRDSCVDAIGSSEAAGDPLLFDAARSGLLLGDRGRCFAEMRKLATTAGAAHAPALGLLLKLTPADESVALLKPIRDDAAAIRTLIRAIGVAGNPHFVPWLVDHMNDPMLCRLAGESFSLITGVDFAHLDLERQPPENIDPSPNDDPADDNVAIDEDDSLPWPDPGKIAAWWKSNGSRFTAGARYFVGEPPTAAHCFSVLRNGFQRQRRHAAEYLCLLQPGTPLFNIAAPAWRQQRVLAQMSGS
jgi:uncharacterized protein (TIGR02270 family)